MATVEWPISLAFDSKHVAASVALASVDASVAIPLKHAWHVVGKSPLDKRWTASNYSELWTDIDTVQGMWVFLNSLQEGFVPVDTRVQYHVMRAGVWPIFEDAAHAQGGNHKALCKAQPAAFQAFRTLVLRALGGTDGCETTGVSFMPHSETFIVKTWAPTAAPAHACTKELGMRFAPFKSAPTDAPARSSHSKRPRQQRQQRQ